MATLDTGAAANGRRRLTHDIPLIPFIDFMLCLIAFLLVTAVWSQMARINADARVPGDPTQTPTDPTASLHVEMKGQHRFRLAWKTGSTVMNTIDVPRQRVAGAKGDFSYPALAQKIAEEWRQNGSHRGETDPKLDQAVLHTDNTAPFSDVIAVIDAIHSAQRTVRVGGAEQTVPAFNVAFATD